MTLDVWTYDDLAMLYRAEMRTSTIVPVNRDLYRHMAALVGDLEDMLARQMELDPESVMCEGARDRLREARRLERTIRTIRAKKVAAVAAEPEMDVGDLVRTVPGPEVELFKAVRKAVGDFLEATDSTEHLEVFI